MSSNLEQIPRQFAEQLISDPLRRSVFVSSRVLKFFDQKALKSDRETFANDCSEVEESMFASSRHTAHLMFHRSDILSTISIVF